MSVVFVDNPSSPGAKQEMEQLRRENRELKREVNELRGQDKYTIAAQSQETSGEQRFTSGNCTIVIKPLTEPLRMNPAFAGAAPRVGAAPMTPKRIAAKIEPARALPVSAETEEAVDDALVRFQMIELK